MFAAAIEPVESGLVASLVKPGGQRHRFLGTIDQVSRLPTNRNLYASCYPIFGPQCAVIADAGYSASVLEKDRRFNTARKFGIEVYLLAIRRVEDIAPVFETLKSGTQALYVCPSALVNANRSRINTLALGARLPTIHGVRDLVGAGGLLSYGANNTHLFLRSAEYVDKILKGAKPADLPVEQPTKFRACH